MVAVPKKLKLGGPRLTKAQAIAKTKKTTAKKPVAPTGAAPPAAAPAAPPAWRTPETAGMVPQNYKLTLDEIYSDPVYMAAVGEANVGRQSRQRLANLSMQDLITRGGWDLRGRLAGTPDLAEATAGVDEATWAAAAGNQLSDRAQIEQARQQEMSDLAYRQAARGTLRSGAYAAGASGIRRQTDLALENAQSNILGAIRGQREKQLADDFAAEQARQATMAEVAARLGQQQGAVYPEGTLGAGPYDQQDVEIPGTNVTSAATPPIGVQWGGRTWLRKQPLATFLAQRGQSYQQWQRQHKAAARRLR